MEHNCPKNKATIRGGTYITGCKLCINNYVKPADFAAKFKRDRMKENARGDILQRYDGDKLNKEWVAMHTDKAIEQFGQQAVTEVLRK